MLHIHSFSDSFYWGDILTSKKQGVLFVGTVLPKFPMDLSAFHPSHKAKAICIFRPPETIPSLNPPYMTCSHLDEAGNSPRPWNSLEPDASMGLGFSIQDTMQDSPAFTSQPWGC